MSFSSGSPMKTPTKRPHPDQEQGSPKFIKPSDIFRKRAKRSQQTYSPLKCFQSLASTFTVSDSNSSSNNSVGNNGEGQLTGRSPVKRPTTFSPLMKKLVRSPSRSAIYFPVVRRNGAPSSHQHSGSATKSSSSLKRPFSNTFSRVLDFSEDANFFPDKAELGSSPSKGSSSAFHPLSSQSIDWSLKTKLRLTTNRAIPFSGEFKAIDEATGLTHFVHGVNASASSSVNRDNFAADLHRHCLVWQHPSLPWVKLFPRAPDMMKPGSTVSSTTPIFSISATSSLAESLHSDFCTSLHSLFKLLKSKHCPYFYLCANNFTVIFRASGVAGSVDAHALITPTAIGLRKLLKEEGVEFSMPFHPTTTMTTPTQHSTPTTPVSEATLSDNSCSSSGIGTSDSSDLASTEQQPDSERRSALMAENDDDDDDDDEVHVSAEENENILESLGLSQQDFPSMQGSGSLRRRRIITSKHKGGGSGSNSGSGRNGKLFGDVDDQSGEGRMKSLVRVDGLMNCQTLLSLFINHRKICVSNSGAFSGIPPTLLSPVAFHGATLTPIAVKQKVTTTTTGTSGTSTNLVSLDVIGPILPHTLHGLVGLFGRFCAQSATSTSTGPGHHHLTMVRSSMRTYDQSASFALEIGQRRQREELFSGGGGGKEGKSGGEPTNSSSGSGSTSTASTVVVNPTFAVENLEESGLEKRFLTAICTADRQLAVPLADFELTPSGIRYNRSLHSKK